MRADKVRALEVRDKAVSDMETAAVGSSEAYNARDRALAAHRETSAMMNVVEQEVLRLSGELEVKAALLAELDRAIPELQKKADAAGATAAKAVAQKEAAIRRANELERLLADKAGEADELRAAAVAAEARMTAAIARVKGLEDDAAVARARVAAVERTDAALEAEVARLAAEASAAGQRAAAGEAELQQLKDELAKRPPIDIIRQLGAWGGGAPRARAGGPRSRPRHPPCSPPARAPPADVENLMQRNMQAAAAMHSLLAWRDAHEAHPGPQVPPPE